MQMWYGPLMIPTTLYARQSLTRNGSESLPAQIANGRSSAPLFGCEIVSELVEAPSTSGYKKRGKKRPKFLELLEQIRSGKVRAVWVYKSDRLSRGGGPGWAPLLEAFEAANIDVDRAVLTPNGWMSEFEIGIRSTMDREESKKAADRIRDLRLREARAGKISTGGYRPFGRLDDGVTPHPVEAPIVEGWAEALLGGATLYSLVAAMNRSGITTTGGHAWSNSNLRKSLMSPRNAGVRVVDGQVIDGVWEPLISVDWWDAIKVILTRNKWATPMPHPRLFLLLGYLYCSNCGTRMVGARNYNKRTGTAPKTRYYRCPVKGLGGCGGMAINADYVEGEVRNFTIATFADEEWREHYGQHTVKDRPDLIKLTNQLGVLNARRGRLVDMYELGDILRPEYLGRRTEVDKEIALMEQQIYASSSSSVLGGLPLDPDGLRSIWDKADLDARHQLVGYVLDRLEVKRAAVRGRSDPDRLVWHPRRLQSA